MGKARKSKIKEKHKSSIEKMILRYFSLVAVISLGAVLFLNINAGSKKSVLAGDSLDLGGRYIDFNIDSNNNGKNDVGEKCLKENIKVSVVKKGMGKSFKYLPKNSSGCRAYVAKKEIGRCDKITVTPPSGYRLTGGNLITNKGQGVIVSGEKEINICGPYLVIFRLQKKSSSSPTPKPTSFPTRTP